MVPSVQQVCDPSRSGSDLVPVGKRLKCLVHRLRLHLMGVRASLNRGYLFLDFRSLRVSLLSCAALCSIRAPHSSFLIPGAAFLNGWTNNSCFHRLGDLLVLALNFEPCGGVSVGVVMRSGKKPRPPESGAIRQAATMAILFFIGYPLLAGRKD